MTATERLRQLLDERGVEWAETRDGNTAFGDGQGHMRWAVGVGAANAFLEVGPFTPEQAVEVTLGRGTCRNVGRDGDFTCDECGFGIEGTGNFGKYVNYCPCCGRKAES